MIVRQYSHFKTVSPDDQIYFLDDTKLFVPSCANDFFTFTAFKGTNGRQKTYEICRVYCIFYSGFMRQTTLIFGIKKDGSLVLNTLAS